MYAKKFIRYNITPLFFYYFPLSLSLSRNFSIQKWLNNWDN